MTAGFLLIALQTLPALALEPEGPYGYQEGVKAYRDGNYPAAQGIFARLHRDYPENTRITYYLAITEAQERDFKNARRLYNEILLLDPNGEAAKLAREGLSYLPDESAIVRPTLDAPPKITETTKHIDPEADDTAPSIDATARAPETHPVAKAEAHRVAKPETSQASPADSNMETTPQGNASQAQAAQGNGMSPQDMLMFQMMMGQGGGNNAMGGGFNPMMMMAPQMFGANGSSNPSGNGAAAGIDPGMMSQMLMNQMMQNFSFDSNKDQDR